MAGQTYGLVAALVLVTGAAHAAPHIVLKGEPPEFMVEGAAALPTGGFDEAFKVGVAGAGFQPMAGSYRVEKGALIFHPQFPLQPGLSYRAEYHAGGETIAASFALPKPDLAATTEVEAIFPSASVLPENELKLYIHFSSPMTRGGAYRRLHLIADDGTEVALPFLSLAEELWDADYRRLTVLFDPGRIKRGLVPNRDMGLALHRGHSYTLKVDREWEDARGAPLKAGFTKRFSVGPDDRTPLDPKDWKVAAPKAGGTASLTVDFPEPLDHALLLRVLTVTDAGGEPIDGSMAASNDEKRWLFTPAHPWQAGRYDIRFPGLLEDLAGNKVYTPFDVDVLTMPMAADPEKTYSVPFTVAK